MKRLTILIPLLLVFATGCKTNAEKAYTFRVLLNATVQDTVTLRQQKQIPDAQFAAIKAIEKDLQPVPDMLDSYVNGTLTFMQVYNAYEPKLADIVSQIATIKAALKSTTQPTGATSWIKQPSWQILKAA